MAQTQYTLQQYTALTGAIAQGVTSVKYGDKEVNFRSLDEMLRIKNLMEVALGLKRVSRKKYVSFSKGLR